MNQHAAVNGPNRFQLFPGHQATVNGSTAETPSQKTVASIHGVDKSVGRSKQNQPLVVSGRRINSSARCERPKQLAVCGIQSVHRVGVHRGDEHFADGDGQSTQTPAQLCLPRLTETRRNRYLAGTAASGVVSESGPVSLCRSRTIGTSVSGALLQTGRRGQTVLAGARNGTGGQRLETGKLGFQLAAARVHSGIHHAVTGHDAIDAPATHPVVGLPMFRFQIDEFRAVAPGQQVLVRRFGRIAAMVEPVDLDVRREFPFHFAGRRIVADKYAVTRIAGNRCGPNESVRHHEIFQ